MKAGGTSGGVFCREGSAGPWSSLCRGAVRKWRQPFRKGGRVFLLSISGARQLFSEQEDRRCCPTAYALAQGASESEGGDRWWWLRSPGGRPGLAACVSHAGYIHQYGGDVHFTTYAVCPGLWIDLSQ